MEGIVFDIKEFSLHDGPGVRTTVFLKGCPLRCVWCHNPEGLSAEPQLMIKRSQCEGCGSCRRGCQHAECQPYGRCLHACPKGLISLSGERITPSALAERLLVNREFFSDGGGVTFSGGEPTLQTDFLLQTAALLEGIHLTVETCGYASPQHFRAVVDRMDYVIMDIKLCDEEQHKRYTGRSNRLILDNFAYLRQSGKPYLIRTPLIPGVTDTREILDGIRAIIGDSPWELLDYNPFASAKYPSLDMTYPLAAMTAREAGGH